MASLAAYGLHTMAHSYNVFLGQLQQLLDRPSVYLLTINSRFKTLHTVICKSTAIPRLVEDLRIYIHCMEQPVVCNDRGSRTAYIYITRPTIDTDNTSQRAALYSYRRRKALSTKFCRQKTSRHDINLELLRPFQVFPLTISMASLSTRLQFVQFQQQTDRPPACLWDSVDSVPFCRHPLILIQHPILYSLHSCRFLD
jgi:hypothetical protein